MNGKTLDPLALNLGHGGHQPPNSADDEICINELCSMLAGEPFGYRPVCVSRVLQDFALSLNDRWDFDARQKLKPFARRMLNTANDGQDEARGWLAIDWLIRTYTPAWLDLAGLTAEAAELRSLRRIADSVAWRSMQVDAEGKISAARSAARSAAYSAACSAACSAARSAARSAAYSAARSAARSAAYSAARSAARSAAYSAAYSALKPTVEILQASALELLDKMIDPSAVAA
jgi:hypothetical protein